LPWPADKPFRILSLDGGGIRGIYAATMLARVEAKITKGEPIADYFDTIAGTSTGGVIALGLGLKKPRRRNSNALHRNGRPGFS
jgi:patatin-like phospholipase/acyl hydrolase